jgi:hypothetical protein
VIYHAFPTGEIERLARDVSQTAATFQNGKPTRANAQAMSAACDALNVAAGRELKNMPKPTKSAPAVDKIQTLLNSIRSNLGFLERAVQRGMSQGDPDFTTLMAMQGSVMNHVSSMVRTKHRATYGVRPAEIKRELNNVLNAVADGDKQEGLRALSACQAMMDTVERELRNAPTKSAPADDVATLLMHLLDAANSSSLAAVRRVLNDLNAAALDEEERAVLKELYNKAAAARESKEWKKVQREAGRMLTKHMMSGTIKSLVPNAKVLVKSIRSYGRIKECGAEDGVRWYKGVLTDADGNDLPGTAFVATADDLQVRSQKAYKRRVKASALEPVVQKVERVQRSNVLLEKSILDNLIDYMRTVLKQSNMSNQHYRALQMMISDVGAARNWLKPMKPGDIEARHSDPQAAQRVNDAQFHAKVSLGVAVDHGERALNIRTRDPKLRQPGQSPLSQGQHPLRSAQAKAAKVRIKQTKG